MKRIIVFILLVLVGCSQSITNQAPIDFESDNDYPKKYKENDKIELQSDSEKKESGVKKNYAPKSDESTEKKDVVTYGSVRYEEAAISFKTLTSVNDSNKEQGTSGYISKGSNGLNRKEVRDVYINGRYTHTETVKETYIVSNPTDEQKWIGTKEPSPIEEELEEINYIFYKTYDSFDTCNYQANELARINSKKGWLSTMCDGPNLYYTLRD